MSSPMTSPFSVGGAEVVELDCLARSDAGIVAVWNSASFTDIDGAEAWEDVLLDDEDIVRHTAAGCLVPINIGADGAWQILVRSATVRGSATLTEREAACVLVSSEPYLLVSVGTAIVSGYERIDHHPPRDLNGPPRQTTTQRSKKASDRSTRRHAGWPHHWQPGGPLLLAELSSGWPDAHGRD